MAQDSRRALESGKGNKSERGLSRFFGVSREHTSQLSETTQTRDLTLPRQVERASVQRVTYFSISRGSEFSIKRPSLISFLGGLFK